MKTIYLKTTDPLKKSAIEDICKEQNIGMYMIKGTDINRTIAAVCGVHINKAGNHRRAPAIYTLPEMVLFFGIDDDSLDSFLDAYNAAGLEKIRRKAVVTPTNLNWTLYELAEELEKEIFTKDGR
ncbi:MAG: DUF3783 domain-containing protein [Lachnospiraceae bacterium]|nr:DUF3783 domain-containing protein [Lachnospiraceae bacterium]